MSFETSVLKYFFLFSSSENIFYIWTFNQISQNVMQRVACSNFRIHLKWGWVFQANWGIILSARNAREEIWLCLDYGRLTIFIWVEIMMMRRSYHSLFGCMNVNKYNNLRIQTWKYCDKIQRTNKSTFSPVWCTTNSRNAIWLSYLNWRQMPKRPHIPMSRQIERV